LKPASTQRNQAHLLGLRLPTYYKVTTYLPTHLTNSV